MEVPTQEFQKSEVERRLLKAKLAALGKVAAWVVGLPTPLSVVALDYLDVRSQAHTHEAQAPEVGCSWWELGCDDG